MPLPGPLSPGPLSYWQWRIRKPLHGPVLSYDLANGSSIHDVPVEIPEIVKLVGELD